MDTTKTEPTELSIKIGNINGIAQERKRQEGIFLFFSFDLVNSTSFKARDDKADIWPIVITHFYELIQSAMRSYFPEIIVWKYLGDEILLYFSIDNIEKVYESPRHTYKIQNKVLKTLDERFSIKSELDIKSTLWIAGVTSIPAINMEDYESHAIKNDSLFRNIEFTLSGQNGENGDKEDFLGQDIDVGFRIAKFANKRKVALSVGLAYLLYKMDNGDRKSIDKEMKIVSFEPLKGVWNNRAYPIIWYYPDWKNVAESFDYDEHKNNEIVNSIHTRSGQDISALENILEQLGKKKYHNQFNDYCLSLHRNNDTVEVQSK